MGGFGRWKGEAGENAAINGDDGAGNVRRRRGGHEHDHFGHLPSFGRPPERDDRSEHFGQPLAEIRSLLLLLPRVHKPRRAEGGVSAGEIRGGQAGTHAVHADSLRREQEGGRTAELIEGRFGHRIEVHVDGRALSGGRRNVHDVPLCLLQVRDRQLAQSDHTEEKIRVFCRVSLASPLEVHFEEKLEGFHRKRVGITLRDHRRVVHLKGARESGSIDGSTHEDVQPTESFDRAVHEFFLRLRITNVPAHDENPVGGDLLLAQAFFGFLQGMNEKNEEERSLSIPLPIARAAQQTLLFGQKAAQFRGQCPSWSLQAAEIKRGTVKETNR